LRSSPRDRLLSLARWEREGLLVLRLSGLVSGSLVSTGGLGSVASFDSPVTTAFLASAGLASVTFGTGR
jgi:hypothetical protein